MEPDRHPSSPLSHDDWQHAYELVLRESDNQALFKRIEVAEAAILLRRDVLKSSPDQEAECKALADALAHIRSLKKNRLGFDDRDS